MTRALHAPTARRPVLRLGVRGLALCMASGLPWSAVRAQGDALAALRGFLANTQSGEAGFTQTVTAPDGKRQRVSSGRFEFVRPNRFRFEYRKPFEQLIVGDGRLLWIFDPDLKQATSRPLDAALGSTPAALLAGHSAIERSFELSAQAPAEGLQWVAAKPRQADAGISGVRLGFRGSELVLLELLDGLGQRSIIRFEGWRTNVPLPAERFVFVPPAGTDVIVQ
jgi:outer membrane lipoprotein carrier protein